jgi:CHAT domain-containing protein/Flp pilus assembly protein TadD
MKKILFISLFYLFCIQFAKGQLSATWRLEYDSARMNFINGKPELTARWLESFLPQYKKNLKDTAQFFEMVHLLARSYMRLAKPNEAEKLFKEDINYFKSNPEEISKTTYIASSVYLGYLYYQRRELEQAENYFEEAARYKRMVSGESNDVYATLLNNLAVINNVQRDYTKADSLYKKLVGLKKQMHGAISHEMAATLTTIANMHKRSGKYNEAEPLYAEVVSIRKQLMGEQHPEYLKAHKNLADLYLIQGRYNLVEPIYKKILETSRVIYTKKDIEYTNAMNNLGHLYEQMNRFSEAEPIFQEVLAIREESIGMNNFEYTDALINLGNLYKSMSEYRKSEAFFKSALSIYEVITGEKHEAYIAALVNLAGLYRDMGRLQEAEPLYAKAQKIYKETAGEKNIPYANLLNNIAIYYDEVGQYELSENYYRKALEITRSLLGEDHPQYATTLNNMGRLYTNTGHFEQAEPLFIQSAQIRKATIGEKHQDYAASINNLASLYENMGRVNEAEPLYMQALKIVKDLFGPRNPYYANALNNLAGLYQHQKKYQEAEKLYKESLDITKDILGENHYTYAIALNNLALLQQQRGDYKQSEKLYLENITKTKASLGNKHPNYAAALSNLAGLYEHTGKYSEAEKLYLEALNIRRDALGIKHPAYTSTTAAMARLYTAMKNYNVADTLWERTIKNYLYEIQTYFPSMSEKEKGQFYQTIYHDFETFNTYALLRAPSNPAILGRMYDNQLATKALLLNSSNKLRHRILASKDTSLVRMFKHWLSEKELLSKIYSLPKDEIKKQHINVDSIEHIANDLEKKLSLKSELFKSTNEVSFYSWQDVKKHLGTHDAAIEIIRFPKYKFDSAGVYSDSIYYAALIVTHNTLNHPEAVILQDGNKMEGKYITLYKNYIRFKLEDRFSYDIYWKKIQEKLPADVKKVYISPDGVYNQINVNTLKNTATNTFVLDQADLRLVTNTKDLVHHQKHVANTKKFLVLFGNPDYAKELGSAKPVSEAEGSPDYGRYLEQLPGTETEVKKINEAMTSHSWQTKIYTGQNASEKNLKSINNPKVLHIATHGFFEKDINAETSKKANENPLLTSGLMLTGASVTLYNKEHNIFNFDKIQTNEEDGILTAYEAMNLNLDHTDLVVLSACETGLGEIKNGEGVYGLQRAFIIAGAKSIIISLWKVNDETTQKLMTYFYQEWAKNDNKVEHKAVAFKRAQTRLKEEFPSPYFWGAFILVQ